MEMAIDMGSMTGAHRPFYQFQVDDFACLGVFVFLSICYAFRGVLWDKPDPHYHLWFEKPQGDGAFKEANTRDIGQKLEQTVSGNPFKFLTLPKILVNVLIFKCRTEQECGHLLGFSIWHR